MSHFSVEKPTLGLEAKTSTAATGADATSAMAQSCRSVISGVMSLAVRYGATVGSICDDARSDRRSQADELCAAASSYVGGAGKVLVEMGREIRI